ncbi:hypothetical protein NDU88_005914 [Pleurodeles waltl]|uniref:Uncharacterized protein n=1 Tax=Pleurodeles waltl TaxID=8319 RepID=A0AAV7NNV4_PLEWA|nr:hypothetical protein NDU88_005914 [Pleurodeles waltl]
MTPSRHRGLQLTQAGRTLSPSADGRESSPGEPVAWVQPSPSSGGFGALKTGERTTRPHQPHNTLTCSFLPESTGATARATAAFPKVSVPASPKPLAAAATFQGKRPPETSPRTPAEVARPRVRLARG